MATARSFRHNQPYSFMWCRPERGFEIASAFEIDLNSGKTASKPATYLIERSPLGVSKGIPYFPLREKTGLFKTFAVLPVKNHEHILEFANAYGPLDHGSSGLIGKNVVHRRLESSDAQVHSAEPLAGWCDQIALMKWLLRVWEAVRNKEQPFLKRLIRWEQGRVIARLAPSLPDCPRAGMETIASADIGDPRMWSLLKHGDFLDPAMLYVQRNINTQLEQFPSRVRMLWDHDDSFVFIEPANLAGALWLQLALAVDGNRDYRVCEQRQCREWFEIGGNQSNQKRSVGADHRRTDARFCSDACKQKKYRAGEKKGKNRKGKQ